MAATQAPRPRRRGEQAVQRRHVRTENPEEDGRKALDEAQLTSETECGTIPVSSELGDADLDPRSRKFKLFGKTPIHAALTQGLTWIGVLLLDNVK